MFKASSTGREPRSVPLSAAGGGERVGAHGPRHVPQPTAPRPRPRLPALHRTSPPPTQVQPLPFFAACFLGKTLVPRKTHSKPTRALLLFIGALSRDPPGDLAWVEERGRSSPPSARPRESAGKAQPDANGIWAVTAPAPAALHKVCVFRTCRPRTSKFAG